MKSEEDKFIQEITKIMNDGFGEKTVMEYFLSLNGTEPELREIGYVNDFQSEYRNDLFETIFEDENGVIIDCRIRELRPSDEELENYKEYWKELTQVFCKPVSPIFILTKEED